MNKLFMFPGYGSQLEKMFDALPRDARFVHYLDAIEAATRLDIAEIVAQGSESDLSNIKVAYPAIVLNDLTWGNYLAMHDIGVRATCGYGIGEVAAMSMAGVISTGAALTLASFLATTYEQTAADSDGIMEIIVGLSEEEVASVIAESSHVWISAINSPRQIAISGVESAVSALEPAFESAGARRIMKVKVPGALHSPLMARAQEELAAYLDRAEFRDAHTDFISCVDGLPYRDGLEIKKKLIESITSPINFQKAVGYALSELNTKIALECGAGSLLCGHLASSEIAAIPVTQYSDPSGIEPLVARIESIENQS